MSSPYSLFSTSCILDQKLYLDLGLKGAYFPSKTPIDFSLISQILLDAHGILVMTQK